MYNEKRIKDWTLEDYIEWAKDGAKATANGTAVQVIVSRAIRNEFVSEGSVEEVVAQLLAKGEGTKEENVSADGGPTDQPDSPAVDTEQLKSDTPAELKELELPTAAVDDAANLAALGVDVTTEGDLQLTASQIGLIGSPSKGLPAEEAPVVVKTPAPVDTSKAAAVTLNGPGEVTQANPLPKVPRGSNPLPKTGMKLGTEIMVETELATYARNMAVNRQVTLDTAMTEQLRMWSVIQSIFRTRGSEFTGLYGKLLKFVHDNTGTRAAPGLFYETKAMRGILQLSAKMTQRDHVNFRRIFNLITATCNPAVRALASSQCDLPSALADFGPEQQALITDYYRGV